jgi:hypothetical protein
MRGLFPIVFTDECYPSHDKGNKQVGQRALEAAATYGRPVLVVEDDIDLAPDFTAGLELALSRLDRPTYLYLNESEERMRTIYGRDLADRVLRHEPTPLQLVEAQTEVGLFGTQAVLIPHEWIPRVIDSIGRVRRAFDAALQRSLRRETPPAYVVVPNVVQHRHDRTAREPDGGEKRSLSFDCPREVTALGERDDQLPPEGGIRAAGDAVRARGIEPPPPHH